MLDDWKFRFLDLLSKTQNVTISAERVGKTRSTIYDHRAKNQGFRDAWDEARRGVSDGMTKAAAPIF